MRISLLFTTNQGPMTMERTSIFEYDKKIAALSLKISRCRTCRNPMIPIGINPLISIDNASCFSQREIAIINPQCPSMVNNSPPNTVTDQQYVIVQCWLCMHLVFPIELNFVFCTVPEQCWILAR